MLYYTILLCIAVTSLWLKGDIGDGIRVPKEIACMIGCLVIFAASLFEEKKRYVEKWLPAIIVWMYLHIAFFSREFLAFQETFYFLAAFVAIYSIAASKIDLGWRLYSRKDTVIEIRRSERAFSYDAEGILRFVAWCAVIVSVYVLIQAISWDSYHVVRGYTHIGEGAFTHRIIGFLGNPAVLGSWYAMTLPMFLLQKGKRFKFLFIFCASMMLLTQSTLTYLANFASIFTLALFRKRYGWVIILLAIAMIGGVVIWQNHELHDSYFNFSGRIDTWKLAYKCLTKGYEDPTMVDANGKPIQFIARTLVGFGPFGWVKIIPKLTGIPSQRIDPWLEAHCDPFEIFFNLGLVGLVLYLGFVFTLIWKFLKSEKSRPIVGLFAGLVGYFVSSLGIFPMHIGATAFLGIVYLGLILNLLYSRGGKT